MTTTRRHPVTTMGFPAAILLALVVPASLLGQQATVTPVAGVVEIQVAPDGPYQAVHESGAYPASAMLRTGADGFALIHYADSTEIVVRPDSEVRIGGEESEGIRVLLGRVLIRVRRLFSPGQERAHTTPTTVAAVRGTEFGLAVAEDGGTRVFVFEGRVAVSNPSVDAPPVEVGPGQVTDVAPRRPPTEPRAFQEGEFERGSTGEVERGEDRAVEAGQTPTTARFLAFSDHDLDAVANPAYLSVGSPRGVSGLLLGSAGRRTESVTTDGTTTFEETEGGHRGLAQALAWTQVGGAFHMAVLAQGDAGTDRDVTTVRAPRSDVTELLQQDRDWSVGEGRVLASMARGAYAFGASVGHRQGSIDAEVAPAGSLAPPDVTDGTSDITSFALGIRRGGTRTLGLSYHRALVDSRETTGAEDLTIDGTIDALEVLVRSWSGEWGWGGWLRLERSSTGESRSLSGAFAYREDLDVLTARLGFGVGYMPSPLLLLSLDAAAGVADEAAVQTGPGGVQIEDEDDVRLSGSLHAGAQVTLSGPWRAELSILHSVERISRSYHMGPVGAATSMVDDIRSTYGTQAVLGLIYEGSRWLARYAVSSRGEAGGPWMHALLFALRPGR